MVGATGFEPATSASRTQRSTKLSHAPMLLTARKIIAQLSDPCAIFFDDCQPTPRFITGCSQWPVKPPDADRRDPRPAPLPGPCERPRRCARIGRRNAGEARGRRCGRATCAPPSGAFCQRASEGKQESRPREGSRPRVAPVCIGPTRANMCTIHGLCQPVPIIDRPKGRLPFGLSRMRTGPNSY